MKKVTIYSTPSCPYCAAAKSLLHKKEIQFEEIDVQEEEARDKMIQRAGGARSVPQIFIGEEHVGGFDDLNKLEQEGKLNDMLK